MTNTTPATTTDDVHNYRGFAPAIVPATAARHRAEPDGRPMVARLIPGRHRA